MSLLDQILNHHRHVQFLVGLSGHTPIINFRASLPTHLHTYIHTYIYACMLACIHNAFMHGCMFTHMHSFMHICRYTYRKKWLERHYIMLYYVDFTVKWSVINYITCEYSKCFLSASSVRNNIYCEHFKPYNCSFFPFVLASRKPRHICTLALMWKSEDTLVL